MSTKTRFSATSAVQVPALGVSRLLPAFFAMTFGAFIVLGVGFAQSSAIHNAAHDGRHALSFPCH